MEFIVDAYRTRGQSTIALCELLTHACGSFISLCTYSGVFPVQPRRPRRCRLQINGRQSRAFIHSQTGRLKVVGRQRIMGRVMSSAAMNNGTDGDFSRGNKAAVIVSPPRFEESSSVMLTCKPSAEGHFSDNTVSMMVFIITWAHFKGSFTQTHNTFPHFLLSVHAETTISGQRRFVANSSSSVSIFTA